MAEYVYILYIYIRLHYPSHNERIKKKHLAVKNISLYQRNNNFLRTFLALQLHRKRIAINWRKCTCGKDCPRSFGTK